MPDEPMMTPEDVADWLQVHRHTVYRWIDEGRLPALRIGRVYRIPRAEVEAMVQRWGGGAEDTDESTELPPNRRNARNRARFARGACGGIDGR